MSVDALMLVTNIKIRVWACKLHSSRHPLIHYWNNGQKEVDYVLHQGQSLQAIEVKSGINPGNVSGLTAFTPQFVKAQPLVLGTGGMPFELWLQQP